MAVTGVARLCDELSMLEENGSIVLMGIEDLLRSSVMLVVAKTRSAL